MAGRDGGRGRGQRDVAAGGPDGGGAGPLACAVTDEGCPHRLWALTDPAEQAAVAADLAARTALIADGHHRYAAYGELRA